MYNLCGFYSVSDLRILASTPFVDWANVFIMNTPKYHLQALKDFFDQQKIATLDQLRAVLGDPARCTLFRKLGELEYLSSYSHRGRYYTLKSIARFTSQGLWACRSVWFSRFGNLLKTAAALVHGSAAGYSAAELKEILQVKTKHALIHLVRNGRLQREAFDSVYVYLSAQDPVACSQRNPAPSVCSCLPTVAEATAIAPVCGSINCSLLSATVSGFRSRSAIIRPAPPSGIPSSTGCFPLSAAIGRPSPCATTRPS